MRKLSTYQSKFITFLSHGNTIIIKNDLEFAELLIKMRRVGIELFKGYSYDTLLQHAKSNIERHGCDYSIDGVIVEFENGRGAAIGWRSVEESENWFGEKPFTWKEIAEELD